MVRQRAASGRGTGGSDQKVQSDEDILRERRRKQAFEVADGVLQWVSWGLWVLAGAWFLLFAPSAAAVPPSGTPAAVLRVAEVAGDPVLATLSCGVFCGALSRSCPHGSWSGWRRLWHVVWVPLLALGTLAFARFAMMDRFSRIEAKVALPPASAAFVVAVALAAAAAAQFFTAPSGRPDAPRATGVIWGRMLLVSDALAGGALSLAIALNGPGRWAEPLGPCTVWISVAPLGMWSLGTLLCSADAELVAAVPAVIVHSLQVSALLLYAEGLATSLSALAVALLHAALYLPLPLREPDSNPFHVAFRRWWRRFTALLASPVGAGFGDCGEDGD